MVFVEVMGFEFVDFLLVFVDGFDGMNNFVYFCGRWLCVGDFVDSEIVFYDVGVFECGLMLVVL